MVQPQLNVTRWAAWSWQQTLLINKYRIAKNHYEKFKKLKAAKQQAAEGK